MKKPETAEEAIALAETEFWKDMSPSEIMEFQLTTDLLCMPFDILHQKVQEALDRLVWTHEFAKPYVLLDELHGKVEAPSLHGIMEKLNGKPLIVVAPSEGES